MTVDTYHWPAVSFDNRVQTTREDDYRQNAAEMVKLVAKLPTTADKGRLLRLAEKWLDLADRARGRKRRNGLPEHPMLNDRLGPDQADAE